MSARACDVIVVGSGASAVHAALALVEAGLDVTMLDVGRDNPAGRESIPAQDFATLRRTDPQQHRYFLGENFEGIPFGPVRVGAQLTPPRQFLGRAGDPLAPVRAGAFAAMQSFALGGLGAGWGASTMPWTDADLRGWPIGRTDLQRHYDAVAAHVGICGSNEDDLTLFTGRIAPLMPAARADSNGKAVLKRYLKKREELNRAGFYAGAPRLALCTRRHRGRGPLHYHDMEFWSDHERAVYRPRYTVEELRAKANFNYVANCFVQRFDEDRGAERVRVFARDSETKEALTFEARRVVLGAGAINSARIALRSIEGGLGRRVPLLSNPYTYFPCLNLPRLGKPSQDRRHSLTQVTMIYDPDGTGEHLVQPQLYSYRSLLLFKLLKESPLPVRESIAIMRALQEYFVIVGVFFEDRPAALKFACLSGGSTTGENVLELHYHTPQPTLQRQRALEKRVAGFLRTLGIPPLKTIRPGDGASIHYAGTLPMSEKEKPFTTTPEGALRGAPLVRICDGAVFPHLPAKGLTFTLMANARRVGEALAKELKS